MSMTTTPLAAPSVHDRRCVPKHGLLAGILFVAAVSLAGCSPNQLLGDKSLPPDVPDPAQTQTPAGALAAYRGALVDLRSAFGGDAFSLVPVSGLLTDELRSGDLGQGGGLTESTLFDSRFLPEEAGTGSGSTLYPLIGSTLYQLLNRVRGQAQQARGALDAYAPDSSPAYSGHLDAVEGYADIFLADLFCSGIPLSTLDFGGDFTYQPGSTTAEVYQRAATLFDSALAHSADSATILDLARVGKGRALLALGQYPAAAAAVTDVPTAFQYTLRYNEAAIPGAVDPSVNRSFMYHDFSEFNAGAALLLTMVDAEGGNGLPFLSSADPRSAWVSNGANQFGLTLTRPAKYEVDGSGDMELASGIEARLIQAEAAIQASDASWLVTLNALRTDGTFDTQANAEDPAKTDTLWHAGTGGVPGLAPLADPGNQDARVSLLFRERGYWLFLTGHRQGDLRRLIRQYGRQARDVYPSGLYPGAYNSYGTDVTVPIPPAERVSNPRFAGCLGRGA